MKRVLRPFQYVAYVLAMSYVEALLTAASLARVDVTPLYRGEFASVVIAAVPCVILQVAMAALAIRSLSLVKLCALTMAVNVFRYALIGLSGHASESAAGWLRTASVGFVGLVVSLLLPVLVLALVERWRSRRRLLAAGENVRPDLTGSSVGTTRGEPAADTACSTRRPWYYWDVVLAVLPMYLAILFAPFGLVNYLGGLVNGPGMMFALDIWLLLMPPALMCAPFLLIRMVAVWPRRLGSRRRLVLAWAAPVIVAVAALVPPRFGWVVPPWVAFSHGLRTHMRVRADTKAIQACLRGIDTSSGDRAQGHTLSESDREVCRLPAVARLHPKGVRLEQDETNRPMVRLSWGSGILGSWGLVVGHKDMAIPETKEPGWTEHKTRYGTQRLRERGEYRLPVAPGAYVWYELE